MCVCVCVYVCSAFYYLFFIILYVNCFGRTMLYMCIEYQILVNMYHVSAQGVDERMKNVHYYYYDDDESVQESSFEYVSPFRMEACNVRCNTLVWNLRAVIWFPFPVASLVLLSSPLAFTGLSFFC